MNQSTLQYLEKAWNHHVASKLSKFYSNVTNDFDGFLKAVEDVSINAADEPKFDLYVKVAVKTKNAIKELSTDPSLVQVLDKVKDIVAPLLDLEVTCKYLNIIDGPFSDGSKNI